MALNLIIWLLILLVLIMISSFFSGSETAMMSVNRYRLRHLAKKKHPHAQRVLTLLSRTDRLLGVILIGNTFANIAASAVATLIAVHYLNDFGLLMTTIALTLVVLIFAEAAPKTMAALYPEKVALPASGILAILLKCFYPVVWLVNLMANSFLHLLRFPVKPQHDQLTLEELRAVVNETTGIIPDKHQQMLLRILDLENVGVYDIMVPRNEIYGIDINESWEHILNQLTHSDHAFMPLYKDHIDDVLGMLNLRKVLIELQRDRLTKDDLLRLADEVYFIPEEALVNRQLVNFQERKISVGLVVDEYSAVVGLLTLQDVLEEIVGEFSVDTDINRLVKQEPNGVFLIDGSIELRDLNRLTGWYLPTDGPRTLSGLLIDYLEIIPKENVCAKIQGYFMEVVRVDHNRVKLIRMWPGPTTEDYD